MQQLMILQLLRTLGGLPSQWGPIVMRMELTESYTEQVRLQSQLSRKGELKVHERAMNVLFQNR